MKIIIIGLFSLFFIAGCGSSETTSYKVDASIGQDTQDKQVKLNQHSFDMKLNFVKYNKQDNSLSIQYKTGLPNGTKIELFLNPDQPDSWGKQYESIFEYTQRINQNKTASVKNGLLNYYFKSSDFHHQLFPNSVLFSILRIQVSDTTNAFIKDKFGNAKDFESKYKSLTKQKTLYGSQYCYAVESDDEDSYEINYEPEYSLKSANTLDDIYAYYQKGTVPYKELEKSPSEYENKPASYTGQVLQIHSEETGKGIRKNTFVRLAVNGNPDEVLYVTFQDDFGMEGVVRDDTITVYGNLNGTETYTSTAGYEITIPSMKAIIFKK